MRRTRRLCLSLGLCNVLFICFFICLSILPFYNTLKRIHVSYDQRETNSWWLGGVWKRRWRRMSETELCQEVDSKTNKTKKATRWCDALTILPTECKCNVQCREMEERRFLMLKCGEGGGWRLSLFCVVLIEHCVIMTNISGPWIAKGLDFSCRQKKRHNSALATRTQHESLIYEWNVEDSGDDDENEDDDDDVDVDLNRDTMADMFTHIRIGI